MRIEGVEPSCERFRVFLAGAHRRQRNQFRPLFALRFAQQVRDVDLGRVFVAEVGGAAGTRMNKNHHLSDEPPLASQCHQGGDQVRRSRTDGFYEIQSSSCAAHEARENHEFLFSTSSGSRPSHS